MAAEIKLFVYGTLKRGRANHHFLQGARFIGTARTVPLYQLRNCGEYPGLVRATPGQSIRGEVYAVDRELLGSLDQLEEAPVEFIRAPIELTCGTPAEAYFYNLDATGLPECGPEWLGGERAAEAD